MEPRRYKITPAPALVPPAPLRGEPFVLADGRTFMIPPPTLAQIHGPCAVAFATVVNVIAAEQWGLAVAVENLAQNAIIVVHEAMARNYDIERACVRPPVPWWRRALPARLASFLRLPEPEFVACNACVSCLMDMRAMLPVLTYLTEVSGYRELLKLVGVRPATASLDKSGTRPTIN